jgi:hypothetical protein
MFKESAMASYSFAVGTCFQLFQFGRLDDSNLHPRRRPQAVGREARGGVRACRLAGLSPPKKYYCRLVMLRIAAGAAALALSAAATRLDTVSAVARTMSSARST